MNAWLDLYLMQMKTAIVEQFQYRVANLIYMLGMIAEPVIYLVVWSTVAQSQGGALAGYTAGEFAAYYIIWTLVRNMNIVLTPYGWEEFIQRGRLAAELLRPVHPLHTQLAYFMGWKVVVIVLWLPIAAGLIYLFQPTLNPSLWQIAAFVVALWGGFFVRFVLLWALGMVTFWTTRVHAFFDVYFTLELLLSGRLVPLALLPPWAQDLANVLPFQWAFGFPIEIILGQRTPREVLIGFGAQIGWTLFGLVLSSVLWRYGIRRFSAVGA